MVPSRKTRTTIFSTFFILLFHLLLISESGGENLREILHEIEVVQEKIISLEASDDPERYDRISELRKGLDSYKNNIYEVTEEAVVESYNLKRQSMFIKPSGWFGDSATLSSDMYPREALNFKQFFNGKLHLTIQLDDEYKPYVQKISDTTGRFKFRFHVLSPDENISFPLLSESQTEKAKFILLSPRGNQIIVLDKYGKVSLLSTLTGKQLWESTVHTNPSDAVISRNGRIAAISTISGSLYALSMKDGSQISKLRFPGYIKKISFSPDEKHIIAGLMTGEVSIVNLENRKTVFKTIHNGPVSTVNFSPDNRYAFSGGGDSRLKIIYLPVMKVIWELHLKGSPEMIRISPTGETISALISFVYLGIWKMDFWTKDMAWRLHSFVTSYDYSDDGRFIACSFIHDELYLYEIISGKVYAKLKMPYPVRNVTFLPGTTLLTCSDNKGNLYMIDYEKKEETITLHFDSPIIKIATNHSGEYLSILCNDGKIYNLYVNSLSGIYPLFTIGQTLVYIQKEKRVK